MSQKALPEVTRSLSMRRPIRACSYYWEGTDGYNTSSGAGFPSVPSLEQPFVRKPKAGILLPPYARLHALAQNVEVYLRRPQVLFYSVNYLTVE